MVNPGERWLFWVLMEQGKLLYSHILGLLKAVDGVVEVLGMDPYKNFEKVRKT